MLLALDSSTAAVTAAVHSGSAGEPGSGELLAAETVLDARAAGEQLAPVVERVLAAAGVAPAELTDVVTGTGPGPFTGLRVGIVTARVLALTVGARLHGVCSLDALAAAARGDGAVDEASPLLVATDARRREVYWAVYSHGVERDGPPQVAAAADLPAPVRGLTVVGAGARLYPEALTGEHLSVPEDVDAAHLARLAVEHPGCLTDTEPLYLRRPDSQVPSARKRVLL